MKLLETIGGVLLCVGGAVAWNGMLMIILYNLFTGEFKGKDESAFYVFLLFALIFIAIDIIGAVMLYRKFS